MEPMPFPRVIRTVGELQDESDHCRAQGLRVALVPTMGALHEGHLSLVREARARADVVWMSIFVNPTQFNDPNDFEAYPVNFDRDLALAGENGVDVVFAPGVEELYPQGAQTWVEVEGLSESLCGASRPGHFRGVTTVVSKLFLAARPHVAVFGAKDFQQLAVIRAMERDLGFGIEVVGAPTVREADGVAMSSRNVRLHPEARIQARGLVKALDAAERAVLGGELSRDRLISEVETILREMPLGETDYAELRDPISLALAPEFLSGPTLLALAVQFRRPEGGDEGLVRLIDNRLLDPTPTR
ncbi:MAG: pantoate--beta-alanine ligase [Deltaproteobacteria bacterium]|nr:pantoate--beta-alanine ligase [Deltaproteobacteria bacterium]